MALFMAQEAAQTLQLLSTAGMERRNELGLYDTALLESNDEDNGSNYSISDKSTTKAGLAQLLK